MATAYEVDLLFRAPKTQALDQLTRQLNELDRKAGSLGGKDPFQPMEKSAQGASRAVTGLNVATKGLLSTLGPLLATFTAIGTAKFIFDKTAETEKQTKSLEVLTGSLEKTKRIIAELQAFGAVTPFTSTELIDTAKRLAAFGVSADRVVDVTKRLGDVAGATGADLNGIVTAYGQVVAKGRLQGEELLQFQERGVNVLDELRKMYGLTGQEIQDALSKGKISAEALEVAIVRLTEKGGKYAGGAIAQSTTLSGKLSTLQDNIESLARTIGAKLEPVIKRVLDSAIAATNAIGVLLDQQNNQGRELEYGRRADAEINRRYGPLGALTKGGEMMDQRQRMIDQFRADDALNRSLSAPAPAPTRSTAVPPLTGGTASGSGSRSNPTAVVVVGGMTGGGQLDASRGRSSGPHLHGQRVSGAGINQQIAAALEFPGGRTAFSYGERRRPGYHDGYAGNDYGTPQGTPFRLRPGWSASDMGIQGALGRGMRVSGPLGTFELGHLAGVKKGQMAESDPFAMAESAAQDAERAEEKRRQDRLKALDRETERTTLLAGIKKSSAKTEEESLAIEKKLQNDLLFIALKRAEVEPDPNAKLKGAARAAELAKQDRDLATKRQEEDLQRQKAQLEALYQAGDVSMGQGRNPFTLGEGSGAFITNLDLMQTGTEELNATAVALGDAFANAFTGMVSGSQSADQAMQALFQNISSYFLDMAGKMLASRLAGLLTGLFSPASAAGGIGGVAGLFSGATDSSAGFGIGSLLPGFAAGGSLPGGRPAIVGEAGPEVFVPRGAGTIVSNEMAVPYLAGAATINPDGSTTYNASYPGAPGAPGSRGASGIGGQGRAGNSPLPALTVPFQKSGSGDQTLIQNLTESFGRQLVEMGSIKVAMDTTVINNVEYATTDQVNAATQQGAQQGAKIAIAALQNSVGTRRKIGL
jgi:tape measure domain-containing protein